MDRYTEGQISEWDIITGIILDIQIMIVAGFGGFSYVAWWFSGMTWRNVSDAFGLRNLILEERAQSNITSRMVKLFN